MEPRNQRSYLFKILGVIAGLVFAGYGLVDRQSTTRLKRVGEPATVRPIQNYTAHKQRGRTNYMATFNYKTATGSEVNRAKSFPEEVLKEFEAGRPVKIFYDPRNPSEFVFEKEDPGWLLVVGGVVIGVLALAFA